MKVVHARWRRFSSMGPLLWLVPILATAIAYKSVIQFDFIGDARFLILENPYITRLSYWYQNLLQNYFWSASEMYIPYWRPVTKLSWLLEYQVFGTTAAGYQLVQLGWHILGVLGVICLARHLRIRQFWAMVAGLFYGLYPVAIEPVCLLMARSDVVCSTSVIWAVYSWRRWNQSHRWPWILIHCLSLIGAFGSKEAAVILPAVLTFWALIQLKGHFFRRPLVFSLIPAWTGCLAYLALRSSLIAGKLVFQLNPLRWLAGWAIYLQNLIPFRIESSVRNVSVTEVTSPQFLTLAVVIFLVSLSCLIFWIYRSKGIAVILLGWIAAALIPVLLVSKIHVPYIEGKYAFADRWLYQALGPASLLLVYLLGRIWTRRLSRLLGIVSLLWFLGLLIVSEQARQPYTDETVYIEIEDRKYADTPPAYRTKLDTCRFLDRRVVAALSHPYSAKTAKLVKKVIAYCGGNDERQMNLLSALLKDKKYPEAAVTARNLLASPIKDSSKDASIAYLSGLAFFKVREWKLAEHQFLRANALGLRNCNLFLYLADLSQGLKRLPETAVWLERAFICSGQARIELLIAAAKLFYQVGNLQESQRVLKQLAAYPNLTRPQKEEIEHLKH